jgi:hypothetical protein
LIIIESDTNPINAWTAFFQDVMNNAQFPMVSECSYKAGQRVLAKDNLIHDTPKTSNLLYLVG